MPVIKCPNGKYKWGENGKCLYETYEQARNAGIAIEIAKHKKLAQLISQETFTDYPVQAIQNARKVLEMRKDFGNEVAGVTKASMLRANLIATKQRLSYETVKRMAQFSRFSSEAEINPEFKDTPHKDSGYTIWLTWGGTEGINWAKKKIEHLDKESEK